MAKSMLSGFGAASLVEEDIEDSGSPDLSLKYERFPGSEFCKKYKGKRKEPGHYPAPDECILEMVNQHLQVWYHHNKPFIKRTNLINIKGLLT